jgi:hypothetical protein
MEEAQQASETMHLELQCQSALLLQALHSTYESLVAHLVAKHFDWLCVASIHWLCVASIHHRHQFPATCTVAAALNKELLPGDPDPQVWCKK